MAGFNSVNFIEIPLVRDPEEAEDARKQIRQWLEESLPDGSYLARYYVQSVAIHVQSDTHAVLIKMRWL